MALLKAEDFPAARASFLEALLLNPDSAANHINVAYALQRLGEEADAVPHLRCAASLDPDSFDAHYMLGGALESSNDLEGAAEQFRLAIQICPDYEPAHADLCRVLCASGDLHAAQVAITAALALNRDNADFHNYLGNLRLAQTDPLGAAESYKRALALHPAYVQVHHNLGLVLHAQKLFDEAAVSFGRALGIDPMAREVHVALGLTRKAQGRLAEAARAFQCELNVRPDNAQALNHLGIVLQESGKLEQAIVCYRRAISLRPELPGGYANLGLALYDQGAVAQAVETYRRGLAIKSVAEIHDNLAIALQKQGAIDEAIAHYHEAIALQPENLNTRCNLASALADGGGPQEAIAAYRQILELRPDHLIAHSNLLFNLSVDEHCTAADYLAEARRFDRKVDRRAKFGSFGRPARAEGRRLRVGVVSGDLRGHPVGYFLEGVLSHLDPSKLELFAYPTIAKEDSLTARIKPLFAGWRLLKGLSDEAAARAIRSDDIDILLDLAGHTGDNRLPIFGLRPARVQVSWLGYFASTGVSEMDYVLADEICVPAGNEHFFTETVWRLPQTRLCFTPPATGSTPDVTALPALQRGHITFGCFQRLPKINDCVLALWGQIFNALPSARLVLQSHQTGRPIYVKQILERLSNAGIDADRVAVRGPAHRSAYLESYRDVDIVLDTFPYTGGTTTCEALWMGVPTLTLAGESMIGRQGAALLNAAGLQEWVAEGTQEYVRKAVAFSEDIHRLSELRTSLRECLPSTPLFDVRLFAGRLEDALQAIWKAHSTRGSGDAAPDRH